MFGVHAQVSFDRNLMVYPRVYKLFVATCVHISLRAAYKKTVAVSQDSVAVDIVLRLHKGLFK